MRAKSFKGSSSTVLGGPKPKKGRFSKDIEEEANFSQQQLSEIRESLLCWYDENHRILPWRRNYHSKVAQGSSEYQSVSLDMPEQQFMYGIWVSEVMSQQTQVPRAALYFKKWMAKWPTVQDLAKASIEEVNEVWAGLGYYRRARFLLDGAKYVVEDLGGVFPGTSAELQKIPGVGAYTGAAMASIAAGERVAAVDANVMRILARLKCLQWEFKCVKQYSQIAEQLVDPNRPGDFNQAMMELGASVCTIHQPPSCTSCPIQSHCLAFRRQQLGDCNAQGEPVAVTDYPVKTAKAKRRQETAACCVLKLLHPDGQTYYLLVCRPAKGLLAGLYEMPLKLVDNDSPLEDDDGVMDDYLKYVLGFALPSDEVRIVKRKHVGSVSHTFSHIRLTLRVQLLTLKGPMDVSKRAVSNAEGLPGIRWMTANEVSAGGLSSSVAKVFKLTNDHSMAERKSIKQFFKGTPGR